MARGPKRHMKRVAAPNHWMLGKLDGVWAPKPSAGPHKSRECLPLIVLLRNRLKYALTGKEVQSILMQRLVCVDHKARTDTNYPAGFMDVISIEKNNEHFRLLLDVKGRFVVHKIKENEAQYKLCKVKKSSLGAKGIPCVALHDSRTIRFPDPMVSVNDSVKVDIKSNKIIGIHKFDVGNVCMITGGSNIGRVGVIQHREHHQGSHEIIHVKDKKGQSFATRMSNVFIIGTGSKADIDLPKGKGVKLSIVEEQARRERSKAKA